MSEKLPKATHAGPLRIAGTEIPAYVLETGERILSTRGIMKSLGRTWRGRKYTGTQLPVFVEAKNLTPFITSEIRAVLTPVRFKTDKGVLAEGLPAEALPAVCDVYLQARDATILTEGQKPIARVCDILVRGFARVGIIALVDEATGYQELRDRIALEKILERWISKELLPWTKTFPDEFYRRMFELNNWPYDPASVKRPQLIGKWTNEYVYERLDVEVLERLKKYTPRDTKGRLKDKLFQRLTLDLGYPKLREHLAGVIAIMRIAPNWSRFKSMMARAYPKKGETLELPLDDK